jgi:hypothetical protein
MKEFADGMDAALPFVKAMFSEASMYPNDI